MTGRISKKIYHEFPLIELGLLPNNWVGQIWKTVNSYAILTQLDGQSSTSREPENSDILDVHVVTGDIIHKNLSWLADLYNKDLKFLASQTIGKTLFPSSDIKSGININVLKGCGARYEWHVDSNPLTGVLFVTTHRPDKGGELVFKLGTKEVLVEPVAGKFIIFDARTIPHTVLPLNEQSERISIPMNYFYDLNNQQRPSDLDDYLYEH